MNLGAWIFSALAFASIASMLVGRPWTIPLGKRHTSPDVWSTDLFLETNLVVTAAWALLFMGGAALSILAPLWTHLPYGALLVALGRLSPRFATWYSSRRLRALGLAP